MKRLTFFFLIAAGGLLSGKNIQAHPFRGQYVCVPPISANANPLEFQIRDGGGACQEGETFMQVHPHENGSAFLLPSNPPLDPEAQKDYEAYKKYYGK